MRRPVVAATAPARSGSSASSSGSAPTASARSPSTSMRPSPTETYGAARRSVRRARKAREPWPDFSSARRALRSVRVEGERDDAPRVGERGEEVVGVRVAKARGDPARDVPCRG